jgi:hypothetical protein
VTFDDGIKSISIFNSAGGIEIDLVQYEQIFNRVPEPRHLGADDRRSGRRRRLRASSSLSGSRLRAEPKSWRRPSCASSGAGSCCRLGGHAVSGRARTSAPGREYQFAADADSRHSIRLRLNGRSSRCRPEHVDPKRNYT